MCRKDSVVWWQKINYFDRPSGTMSHYLPKWQWPWSVLGEGSWCDCAAQQQDIGTNTCLSQWAKYCHFFRSCQRYTSFGRFSSLKHWLRQYWQLIVHARAWIRKQDGSQSQRHAIDEAMICVLLGTILQVWLVLFSLAFYFGFYCKSKALKKDVIWVKIFFYYKGSPLKVMFKGVQHV